MAGKLENVEVTTTSGIKATYRVDPDEKQRYERMSKQNEEQLKKREERAERRGERGGGGKQRQPQRGATTSGDVKTKA